jgi:ring-1,2-phenylacetyl-CoA epoxidase subunit PaaE
MFREELASLKDRFIDRFNLVHVLSREAQDIELLHGRIDRARAEALLDRWVPLAEVDAGVRVRPRRDDERTSRPRSPRGATRRRRCGSSASPRASEKRRSTRSPGRPKAGAPRPRSR